MVAPVIMAFGSEAQKARYLPRILSCEDWWCQGYSEPGAGSDLASLKTTAERQGDHYIVNGQKTWTTLAQHADMIFCLVRTDSGVRKQEGISFLLIDMHSPGVTVRGVAWRIAWPRTVCRWRPKPTAASFCVACISICSACRRRRATQTPFWQTLRQTPTNN